MRQIGSLPAEGDARAFGDYLLASGIANMVEPDRDGFAVWVENDDHLERARAELQEFLRAPENPKYLGASQEASAVRVAERRKQQRRRTKYVDFRTSWAGGSQRTPQLTMMLLAMCLVVAALTKFGDVKIETVKDRQVARGAAGQLLIASSAGLLEAHRWSGLSEIAHGQVWRLITPILVHFGIVHLVFNLFWLVDLGGMIERNRGAWFLGVLVLVSGIMSNLGQYFWDGPFGGGMSGVVYALFGYAWMKSRYEPHMGMHVRDATVWMMLIWLVVCMTPLMGGVANAAHVVGLVVGILVGGSRVLWKKVGRGF